MPTFSEVFERALDKAQFKQLTFARKVGTSQGFLSSIIRGTRTPPLDRLDKWADALGLKGDERAEFVRLANLAHCPELIREDYLRMRTRLERLERRVAEYGDKYKP